MSWLGNSINERFNSIKGQIATFTNDVLAEEELGGIEGTQLGANSNYDQKETNALIFLHKQQSDEQQRLRSELEDRLRATELHSSQRNAALQKQLHTTQKKLSSLQEKSKEWEWDNMNGEQSASKSQKIESDQIKALQDQLSNEKDAHQIEISALQDQYQSQISQLIAEQKRIPSETKDDPDFSLASNQTFDKEVSNNEKLPGITQDIQMAIEAKDSHISELQNQIDQLNAECGNLKEEKDQLAINIDELDSQHQQAIDQILKSRKELTEDLTSTKLQLSNAELDITELRNAIRGQNSSDLKTKKEEVENSTEEDSPVPYDNLSNLMDKNKLLMTEIEGLNENTVGRIPPQDIDEVRVKEGIISQLQMQLEKTNMEIEVLRGEKLDADKFNHQEIAIKSLQEQMITTKTNFDLLTTAKEKMIHLKDLQLDENSCSLITMMDKIHSLEEKVLIYEAVCEEKDNEQKIIYSKWKSKEEVIKDLITLCEDLKAKLKKTSPGKLDEKSQKSSSNVQNILDKLLIDFDLEKYDELPNTICDMTSELASLRCDRDRIHEELNSNIQELRDSQDLTESLENEKAELEHECEDLRDQLEELQCGERSEPDGSQCARSLPTIEEEDLETATVIAEDILRNGVEPFSYAEIGWEEKAEQLNLQVVALSEARQNLERELTSVKIDRDNLSYQVNDASGKLGNLVNLEKEASSLRIENQNLTSKLDEVKQSLDTNQAKQGFSLDSFLTMNLSGDGDLGSRKERELLLEQLKDKEKLIEEYQTRADTLEKDSETSRGRCLLDYDSEMDQIRSSLIYKEDQIDELKLGIQQIGELFGLQEFDLRKTYVTIKQDYYTIKAKLHDVEEKLQEQLSVVKENEKQLQSIELQHLDDTKTKTDLIEATEGSLFRMREENESLKQNLLVIMNECNEKGEQIGHMQYLVGENKNHLQSIEQQHLEDIKAKISLIEATERNLLAIREANESLKQNLSVIMSECNEKGEQLGSIQHLSEENKNLFTQLKAKEEDLFLLQQHNHKVCEEIEEFRKIKINMEKYILELQSNIKNQLKEKEDFVKNFQEQMHCNEQEVHVKNAEISTLQAKLEVCQNLSSRNTDISDELVRMHGEKFSLNQKIESLASENETLSTRLSELNNVSSQIKTDQESVAINFSELQKEHDKLKEEHNQMKTKFSSLQQERQQLISASTQKHQESLAYYAEIQKLTVLIENEKQRTSLEGQNLCQQLLDKDQILAALKIELHDVRTSQDESLLTIRQESSKIQETIANLQNEKDHLIVANSSFNSQYEERTKMLSSLQEREKYLTQECSRLREHLVTIEDAYTNEAVQTEQREATLKQTIGKLHEKMSSHSNLYSSTNQKYTDQLDTLKEELREAVHSRDETVAKLHISEEASYQHQEALKRLQHVLQDFQKTQTRDISNATERERRQLHQEREKNLELQGQSQSLQRRIAELESLASVGKNLHIEIQCKEDTIIALKSQVHAVQQAAKKSQSQVALLQTSSEAKVDKHLLRNLVVGYFATPSDKQREVLRIIAHVLDFSSDEKLRTGIDQQAGSWMTSISNFLAPPASNIRVTSKVDLLDHSSLSQAFIRFLEDESAVHPNAKLPAVQMAEEVSQKVLKKAQAKALRTESVFTKVEDQENTPNSSKVPTILNASLSASLSAYQPVSSASATDTRQTGNSFTNLANSSGALQDAPLLVTQQTEAGNNSAATPSYVSEPKFLKNLLDSDNNEETQTKPS